MKSKRNIILVGPMGAGKTTIGKLVADGLKLCFYDSDHVIEARAGVAIDWIWDIEGESGFRKRESAIIDELTQLNGIVLATGGGAVVNEGNRNLLAARGCVFFLNTSIEQQLNRTRRDKKRPLIQTPNPENKLRELMVQREGLYREIADFVVSTDGGSIRTVANQIIKLFSENR